jgi:L-seryl-tRNA(Ser) seleniumtransferase
VLALQPSHPTRFLHALRQANPPIIARLEEEAVVFDPRTVQPEEEGALLVVLKNLTASFR